jgi:HSP20 family protein
MNLTLRREPLGSLFDDVFSDFFNRAGWPTAAPRGGELPAAARARMDVIDKGDRYEVLMDLPGVKKDDIQVTIEGPRVSITAEAKGEKQAKEGERVLHTERYASSYVRSFELPTEVTQETAEAAFENGVLRLGLPKRVQVAGKRLAIH